MTTRPSVSRIWAVNAASANIQDPDVLVPNKVTTGWEAEIPPFQWFNWIQNRNDLFKLALAERGVAEWGSDVSYETNSLTYFGGHIWVSTQPNNGVEPAEGSVWEISSAEITQENLDELKLRIESHIARSNNPHNVTASQVGAYSKDEADVLLDRQAENLDTHESDFNNPHKVTATQAGGVPVTGGTYTGAVDIESNSFTIAKGSTSKPYGLVRSGSDIFLSTTDLKLGIKSQKPVFIEGSTENALLYAGNYKEIKDANEPIYRVPVPDFYMPLTSDINIYEGGGYSSFSRASTATYTNKAGVVVTAAIDEPRFERDGLLMQGSATYFRDGKEVRVTRAADSLDITDTVYSPTNEDCTFTITVYLEQTHLYQIPVCFYGDAANTSTRLAFKDGNWTLWTSSAANLDLGISGSKGIITISFSGETASAYFNGRFTKTVTTGIRNVTPRVDLFASLGLEENGINPISGNIRNFKVWGSVLSKEQISTI